MEVFWNCMSGFGARWARKRKEPWECPSDALLQGVKNEREREKPCLSVYP